MAFDDKRPEARAMSERIENSTAHLVNSLRNHVNALADEKVIDPVRIRYAIADRKKLAAQFRAQGLSNRASADALGVDEKTIRRDLAWPTAAFAAPDEKAQGDEQMDRAAFAADDFAEGVAALVASGEVPERVKDAILMIDSSVRLLHAIGGRKSCEYEKRKFTDWFKDSVCLLWSERAWCSEHGGTAWDALVQQWRSFGVPLDDLGEIAP
jgi:hypothetical protein